MLPAPTIALIPLRAALGRSSCTLSSIRGSILKVMSDESVKQSLYFPKDMLEEIKDEANRLERSSSWVVVRAWKLARETIKKMKASDSDR